MANSRLTFAKLILALQRRAGGKRLTLTKEILSGLRELAERDDGAESEALRQILAAALGIHGELELEGRALDSLSPETVLRLDAAMSALVDGTINRDDLRAALRRALIRPVS